MAPSLIESVISFFLVEYEDKPAGGISTAKSVLEFLILIAEELGFEWVNPKLLRIGASSLLIDIERQLYHYTSGRYANKEKLAIG